MNGLQTPIRNPGGESAVAAAELPAPASPFRTPIRASAGVALAAPTSEQWSTPAAQTPGKAFTPKGKWTNPEAQRVLDDRAGHLSDRQSTMRLRWNVASLVVLAWCSQTGIYQQVRSVGMAAGVPQYVWSSLEWAGLAVLVYNIGEAAWCLLQPKNQYADAAMNPAQRLRMGLDSCVPSAAKGAPVSAPKMTPSKAPADCRTPGSVTDLEARRRTPIKGVGPTTPAGTASRLLRSPVARSGGVGQSDYSPRDDQLTLTQILNRVPGASSLTDGVQGTPTPVRAGDEYVLGSPPAFGLYGAAAATTPRLPMGRHGLGDMPATPMPQHLRGQPTVGLYQTATPARRAGGGEGAKGQSKDRSTGEIDYYEPHEVLERYGAERDILDWVDNMRVWFVRHLLRPLCRQIDELDALFEQHGLGHLSCRRAELDPAALEQEKAKQQQPTGLFGGGFGSGFGSGFGGGAAAPGSQGVPQTLAELQLRYGELPQTKERMALEKYLRIPGHTCRGYVVQRVKTLSQSGALPAYVFDAGGSFVPDGEGAEQPWSAATHPTDGQLLFHLFCTFMDQTMPPAQNTRHPFTDRYVLQPESKPDASLPVQIIQVVRRRPHFCLVVKGAFYDVAPNRNNLFIALALFVLEIQRECAGYLGLTSLGGKHVDLLATIA
ncbi:hypothetical protein IWQ56_000666 [Coemansia nantahalensis]|nr:hypothetical protein IWQ56_000666 [Coemansia nantahalensis]